MAERWAAMACTPQRATRSSSASAVPAQCREGWDGLYTDYGADTLDCSRLHTLHLLACKRPPGGATSTRTDCGPCASGGRRTDSGWEGTQPAAESLLAPLGRSWTAGAPCAVGRRWCSLRALHKLLFEAGATTGCVPEGHPASCGARSDHLGVNIRWRFCLLSLSEPSRVEWLTWAAHEP